MAMKYNTSTNIAYSYAREEPIALGVPNTFTSCSQGNLNKPLVYDFIPSLV